MEENLLYYDDALLPNWKEFAESFQLCHYSLVERFSISDIELSPAVLQLLTPAMSTKQFSSFKLKITSSTTSVLQSILLFRQ